MDISDKTFYTCIDNLIPEEQQIFLQKYLIENKRFNWHLHLSSIIEDDQKEYNHLNINENLQFVHSFVKYDKHEETSEISSSFYNSI